MKDDNRESIWLYLGIVFLIGVFSILGIILSSKVEVSGSADCNSGNVNIKYEQTYREEKIPDFNGNYINITGLTKFKDVPEFLRLDGVDNLNCRGSFHVNGNPIIFNLVYGG